MKRTLLGLTTAAVLTIGSWNAMAQDQNPPAKNPQPGDRIADPDQSNADRPAPGAENRAADPNAADRARPANPNAPDANQARPADSGAPDANRSTPPDRGDRGQTQPDARRENPQNRPDARGPDAPNPNAANGAAQGQFDAMNSPLLQNIDPQLRWRYRLDNGRWMFWLPSNRWVVWNGNQWIDYSQAFGNQPQNGMQPYTSNYGPQDDGQGNAAYGDPCQIYPNQGAYNQGYYYNQGYGPTAGGYYSNYYGTMDYAPYRYPQQYPGAYGRGQVQYDQYNQYGTGSAYPQGTYSQGQWGSAYRGPQPGMNPQNPNFRQQGQPGANGQLNNADPHRTFRDNTGNTIEDGANDAVNQTVNPRGTSTPAPDATTENPND